MSWGILAAGGPVALKDKLAKDLAVPEEVKALASRMLDAVAPPLEGENQVVTLNTSGHFDSYGGSGMFEVKRLTLVPTPNANETNIPSGEPSAPSPS